MAKRRYEISLRLWKGAFLRVSIATVIFSRAKISCFHAKAHLVFHWCLCNKVSLTAVISEFQRTSFS